ncbi:MAG: cobalamin biosynthesis protein CobQ [Gammaproteobacteria bacterium]|nr:MAG: cobalamin biosynthesis protein CobQ [Gammaproteobacteria bacterium]
MKTWVIANQKGGVGKTTTAVSLAGLLAEQGKRVLLVDLDPHASATHYFDLEPDDIKYNLFNCFVDDNLTLHSVHRCITPAVSLNIDLISASMALATLDKSFGARQGMGLKLKNILSEIHQEYDYAIIDCPPLLGVLMINALAACEYLIVPVQTEFLAIKGLERMLKTIEMVYNKASVKPPTVVVPTMFDRRTRASIDSLRYLRRNFSENIWRSVIPIDTRFRDASQKHQTPSDFSANSSGVSAYRQLLKDMLKGTINRYEIRLEAV